MRALPVCGSRRLPRAQQFTNRCYSDAIACVFLQSRQIGQKFTVNYDIVDRIDRVSSGMTAAGHGTCVVVGCFTDSAALFGRIVEASDEIRVTGREVRI